MYIAWCPEHGLHGQRQECFACGGEVEQVPMMSLEAGFRDLVSVARALLTWEAADPRPAPAFRFCHLR